MRPPPGSALERAVQRALAREARPAAGPGRPLAAPHAGRGPEAPGPAAEALRREADRQAGRGGSHLEEDLVRRLAFAGLPPGQRRVVGLVPGRRFEVDLWWPQARLAVEVEGGIWIPNGAHSRPSKIERDAEKASLLACQGIRLVRVSEKTLRSGEGVRWIAAALAWGR